MTRADRLLVLLLMALAFVTMVAAIALPPGSIHSEPNFLVRGEIR